jgi:transcriptional regulator GlxA family with amidase domain
MPFRAGIVIFDRVEELDFIGPWEVLNMATRMGADAEIVLVAENAGHVRCNYGLTVEAPWGFNDCPPLDLILVPGGQGTRTEVDNPAMIDFVRRQAVQSTWTVSVCTGAFLLERAGQLAGRRATTHWASLDRLRAVGNVEVVEERFVVDGNVVSSAGISAGIDMALWLVERLWGSETALKTQKMMEYYPQPPFSADAVAASSPPSYAQR